MKLNSADDLIRELRARVTPYEDENIVWILNGDGWDEVSTFRTFDSMIRGYWETLEMCGENMPSEINWEKTLENWKKGSVIKFFDGEMNCWAYNSILNK